MRAITTNHVLGPNNFRLAGVFPALRNQLVRIIFSQITPEQAIIDLGTLALRGFRLFFREMSQLDGDGVIARGVVVTVVRYAKRFGHHRSFNAKRVFGVFLDVVQEESFNTALMKDDLLKT